MKKDTSIKNYFIEGGSVFICISLISIALLWMSGVFDLEFVLGDHQMYLTIQNALKNNSFGSVFYDFIYNGSQFRFKPLFWMKYVLETTIWGTNWFYLRLWRTIEWSFLYMLLYMVGRVYRCNKIYSIIIASIVLCGTQLQILYDLCVASVDAMIFMVLALLFMRKAVDSSKRIFFWLFQFSVFLVSISLEDYIVCVPILIAMYIFLEMLFEKKSILVAIRDNWKMLLCWVLYFGIIVLYIFVSFDVHGGAFGSGIATNLKDCIYSFVLSIKGLKSMLIIILISGIAVLFQSIKTNTVNINFWIGFILMACGGMIELLIHSKGRMSVRYKLPFMLIIGFMVCLTYFYYKEKRIFIIAFAVCCSICLIPHFFEGLKVQNYYVTEIKNQNASMRYIIENSTDTDVIWLALMNQDDVNLSVGAQMYLQELGKDAYLDFDGRLIDCYEIDEKKALVKNKQFTISEKESLPFIYAYSNYYPQQYSEQPYQSATIIVMFTGAESNILQITNDKLFLDEYYCEKFGNYTVYKKANG